MHHHHRQFEKVEQAQMGFVTTQIENNLPLVKNQMDSIDNHHIDLNKNTDLKKSFHQFEKSQPYFETQKFDKTHSKFLVISLEELKQVRKCDEKKYASLADLSVCSNIIAETLKTLQRLRVSLNSYSKVK